MPTNGQTKYDVWNTRRTNRRTNIDTANPTAPIHARRSRSWFHTSHAVTGSQTNSASQKNGYAPNRLSTKPAFRKSDDRPYPMMRYVDPPYETVSCQSAPGLATRNGTKATTRGAANAATALRRTARGARIVTIAAATNGTATSANCLSAIATPRRSAAQTKRRRERNANASSTQSSDGASAVPNHAARIASGFAAAAAPSATRTAGGPRKASAAKKSPTVQRRTKKR